METEETEGGTVWGIAVKETVKEFEALSAVLTEVQRPDSHFGGH